MAPDRETRKILSRAHGAVRTAIKQGVLKVPDSCERCGSKPSLGKDGRRLIHGHHYKGHEHKLDVVWLCVPCHRLVTPLNPKKGNDVANAKLNPEVVVRIRKSTSTAWRLAKKFNVSKRAITLIKDRKTWAWVEDIDGPASPDAVQTNGGER